MEYPLLILLMAGFFTNSSSARNLTEIRYHFTTCGASGRNGPTPVQQTCAQHYREINSPIQTLFEFGPNTFQGAQGFRLPQAGLYNITVAGASGGRGLCNTVFGFGAVQKLQVELSSEHELLILVGQHGIGPCEVDNLDPELRQRLCEDPPSSFNESEECQIVWREWLLEAYNGSVFFGGVTGGGSGGGASMIRLIDAESGQFANLPLVVAAGGGGSPGVLVYRTNYFTNLNTTLSIEEQYHQYLHGTPYFPNAPVPSGVRGNRDEMSTVISSGAGGGWTRHFSVIDAPIDGMPLSEPLNFAQGGSDCAAVLGTAPYPVEGVFGGFGGGGGGCGGGGGGGGFMGGSVLVRVISVEELGGGGLSVYFNNSPVTLYDRGSGYNTAMTNGYVDIVLSDCGCVHECVVDEEADQFECLCPEDTQLAPDQSDCFKATEIGLTDIDLIGVNQDKFYFSNLSLSSQHFIFSLEINLTTVPNQQRRRQVRQSGGSSWDDKELCAVILVGDESVVLVSNVVRGTGMANLLAPVSHNNSTFVISSYIPFLNSPELVRSALLVSTGSCSVVDMKIRADTSIKEASESSPDYNVLGTINPEIIHNFASRVLQLQASPSPTPATPPTRSSSHHVITAVVVIVVLLVLILLVVLVAVPVGYRSYQIRRARDQQQSHIHVGDQVVEMQFDQQRAKGELNKKATRYLQDFPEEMIFDTSNLHLLDRVGQGEFGIVYRARLNRSTPECEIVAVKTIKGYLDPSDVANILKECLKMKAFVHPHVMGIYGICMAGQAPYIVMPFMANGSLHSYLRKHRIELLISEDEDVDLVCKTQKRMVDMCLQIAKGMEYLTGRKLVHRDLAARNCMLDQNYVIKVADFGLSENTYAKSYFRQQQSASVKLPIKWMAYESLTDGIFSEKTDVWSFGVTCWEIFSTAKTPYPGIHPTSLIAQLENGERLPKPNNASCCDSMYQVMLSCWDADPEQRPTFSQLVTTTTSVLDLLADYLDVCTFVTGEEQEAEATIMECEMVEGKEASQEEWQTTDTDIQDGRVVKKEGAEECTTEEAGSYMEITDS